MKARNREINIFSLSLMDVISGAMGAFLIVVIILARFHAVDQEKYKDPEKLRKRLDAAMHALSVARAGTEKTINNRFVENTRPKTLGLSGGETVPEITALGIALRGNIDMIDNGLADALRGRAVAVGALAHASEGTENIFKKWMGGKKPATLGLSRGDRVPEINKLSLALRSDINEIEKSIEPIVQARKAATAALSFAGVGTGKIIKDRLGEKPATQGHKPGISAPEIKKFERALRSDIDTIFRKLRKGKESEPDTPFAITTVFPCDSGDVSPQIASDETDPSTGKPKPPYTPVPDRGAFPRQGSWSLLNSRLLGSGSTYLLWQPAFAYLNSRPVPGRHYKIYLVGFSSACKGDVIMLGRGVRKGAHDRSLDVSFRESELVQLSWPHDSIVLSDGKRYGMYFLGTIMVSKGADRRISFTRASVGARDAELKAMQERVDRLRDPADNKNDNNQALAKKNVLAKIDNLPVPRDEPSCGRMFQGARDLLAKMKISNTQKAELMPVLDECARRRFPEALEKLKMVMHHVLGEKNDNKPQPIERKVNKPTMTKESALAAIDRFSIPRDRISCIQMFGRARYTLNVVMKMPPAESAAVLQGVLNDCNRKLYPDALVKLKTVMHSLLK